MCPPGRPLGIPRSPFHVNRVETFASQLELNVDAVKTNLVSAGFPEMEKPLNNQRGRWLEETGQSVAFDIPKAGSNW